MNTETGSGVIAENGTPERGNCGSRLARYGTRLVRRRVIGRASVWGFQRQKQ